MLQFDDAFFPVGQGLFYSGTIHFVGKSKRQWQTNFVFDCGSITSKRVLSRSVSKFHRGLDRNFIDFLVLSHLHEDHANGLENLLKQDLHVGAVFLPYLNPSQRLMVGLKCLGQDAAYFEFLANPTAYLLNRRVRRIVYLQGGGGQEPEDNIGDDFPDEPSEDNALDQGINRMEDAGRASQGSSGGDPALNDGRVDQKLVRISLMIGKIWEFRFFNYDEESLPGDQRIDEVVTKVLKELGVDNPVEALKKLAENEVRKRVRSHYRKLAGNQNDLSVMLWHGPRQPRSRSLTETWSYSQGRRLSWCRRAEHWSRSAGSLLTGDIPLSLGFPIIKEHFRSKWPRTSAVQVPHHGSKHSRHTRITRNVPSGGEFVIGAGHRNRYGHPHRSVIVDILRFHECRYVTECCGLEREMWFHP